MALSWLTVLSAITPFVFIVRKAIDVGALTLDGLNTVLQQVLKARRRRLLLVLHSLHLFFTAAFGLWLFIRIRTFDTTPPPDCTSSTLYKLFGHNWPVLNPAFRYISLVLYGMMLVPILTLFLLTLGFCLLTNIIGQPLWWLIMAPMLKPRNSAPCFLTAERMFTIDMVTAAIIKSSPYIALVVFIISSVETTIKVNNVAPGEEEWSLAQTLSLFVAAIPLFDLGIWAYDCSHQPPAPSKLYLS